MNVASYHILYLSSQFPTLLHPQTGVFSLERVRALARAGCQIAVIAPVLMSPHPRLATKPAQLARWLFRQARLADSSRMAEIEVRFPKWLCPPRPIIGWHLSAFLYAQIRRAALQTCAEFQPQVILSSWLPDGVSACLLGERLGLPVLCIADGTDVNEWPEKYPGWRYAQRILNQKASALIYVSEALRVTGAAHGLCPRSEAIIHNAVDVQAFKPRSEGQEDGNFSILAVGRMTRVKGHSVLLEAFVEFAHRLGKPARLTLVGDGPLRPALEKQAAELGITSVIRFAGAVAPEKMAAYYQATNLLCLPSFSEGLPCVVLEAMACGKPVVASKVGGVAELVDAQSGVLVPPGDSNALCEALLRVAAKTWDGQVIRKKIVDGFSWEQWTDKLIQLIHSVMLSQPVE
jgi:teichuronic acid biosynthesis glycosyltransferase TuaC